MSKRSLEVKGVVVKAGVELPHAEDGNTRGTLVGDVRLRVDMKRLAELLGPKAIQCRGNRVTLYDGAIELDGFNSRVIEEPIA